MRPNLTKDISVESFNDFYWLKEELQSFCRENGNKCFWFKNRDSQ